MALPPLTEQHLTIMTNGTILQYFHWYYPADGSLWKKLKKDIPLLQSLGITAVWLPPAYKGIHGEQSIGYDTYDLFDLGEFDQKGSVKTKYGSRRDYLLAVTAAHKAGIAVYVDAVLNHKAGADEREKVKVVRVNPDNRTEILGEPFEIEAYTRFTFPGRKGKYSKYIWDYHSFTGVDYAADLDEYGIFKIDNGYGEGWEDVFSNEFGNYDYLMHADIEFRNPSVKEELKYWVNWYYDTIKFDGIRLDAVKHIAPYFFNEWLEHIKQTIPQPQFVVGEYWSTDNLEILQNFIAVTEGRMCLFDSLLQNKFHQASRSGNQYDLSSILNNTLVTANPSMAVTLVSNHDTQPLQSLEAPVDPWFKPHAYAIILLRKDGYPCVFYPDLFGAEYTDKGKDGNEYTIHMPVADKIEALLKARHRFAYGEQQDYLDHPNCIAWVRTGDEEHPGGCVVVLTNGEESFKDIDLGKEKAGRAYRDFLGNHGATITLNEEGKAFFPATAGSVSVWVEAALL